MTYEAIKNWYKNHRQQGIYGACFVLVFLIGYGSGRAGLEYGNEGKNTASVQVHDTTATRENTAVPPPPAGLPPAGPPTPTPASALGTTQTPDCFIKGNISGQNKIYHVKGGAFYDRTQAEQCFNTEAEAVAAGYRKSSR